MKKKIMMLFIAFALVANFSFASTGKTTVPYNVLSEFLQVFSHSDQVRWEKMNDYFKATFIQKGKMKTAFYSTDGDFIGVSQNMLSDKLPATLRSELKQDYKDYWITDLIRFRGDDGVVFIVSIENADNKLIMKSNDDSSWYLAGKENKI